LDDSKDDEEWNEICQDIEEECSRYGKILDILVPRAIKKVKSEEEDSKGIGSNGAIQLGAPT